jgi:hypothetical protein
MQEVAPSEEEVNKDVQEIAAETKGRDILFGPREDTSTREGVIRDSVNRLKEAFKKQGRFGYHTEKNYNGETPEDIYNRRYNEMIKNNFTLEEAQKEAMWGVKNEAVNRRDANWFAETFNPKNRGMGGRIGDKIGGKIGGKIVIKMILARRIKCLECGKISTPGGIALHQKSSQHKLKERIQ